MPSPLTDLRKKHPIVHCITNHVTANDCANLLLACGASPVMADCPVESAEVTSKSHALVLNLGTPRPDTLDAMLLSGKKANRHDIPVIFDPVGVGASKFRREAARQLLHRIHFAAIRGNFSEIRYLAGLGGQFTGVDSLPEDEQTALACARELAVQLDTKIIVSGTVDVMTDGREAFLCRNGSPILRQITGAGCMLTALTGAFLAVEDSLRYCAAAVCMMGLAGEIAASRMTALDGNATCRNCLIDAVYRMSAKKLKEGAKLEPIT